MKNNDQLMLARASLMSGMYTTVVTSAEVTIVMKKVEKQNGDILGGVN